MHFPTLDGLQRFAWWTLAAAPLMAHAAAWWVRKVLATQGSTARPHMPTLPEQAQDQGTPAARFDRTLDRTLGVVLAALLQKPDDVQADSLAERTGQDPELVRAALDRLRTRVRCRMRVLASGRIVYDFRTADLQRFRRSRALGLPSRMLWLLLGLVVNVGAAWPLLASLVVGAATLERMLEADGDDQRVIAGLIGLGAILATFAVDWLAGKLVAGMMHLGRGRPPRLRDALAPDGPTRKKERLEARRLRKQAKVDRQLAEPQKKGSWDLGDLSGLGDLDGEGCGVMAVLILVALLLAAVAGALTGLALWVRGLWRTLAKPEPWPAEVAPGIWVRDGRSLETVAALVPTSDVASALLKALRHGMRRRRPGDQDLARRVLARARHRQGSISALELALDEGVDLDEAVRVGARLAGLHGGEVHVTPSGELDFRFPPTPTDSDAPEVEPVPPEALEPPGTRDEQPGVRVNVPGLTLSHLRAGERLAAGTLVTAALLVAAAHELMLRGMPKTGEVLDLALPVLAATVFAVLGATRALVDANAALGVRRDARREAYATLRRALDGGVRHVDAQPLGSELYRRLRGDWPGLDPELLRTEVEQAWTDLDLELHLLAERPQQRLYDVRPLTVKLQEIQADRLQHVPSQTPPDAVVFDTGWGDETPRT